MSMCAAEGSDSDTDHSTEHDGGHHRRHLIHRRNQYGSFSSRSLPTAVPKSNGKVLVVLY